MLGGVKSCKVELAVLELCSDKTLTLVSVERNEVRENKVVKQTGAPTLLFSCAIVINVHWGRRKRDWVPRCFPRLCSA